jgi:hypothetical protein
MMMLLVGVAEIALAGAGRVPPSPEIDASAAVSALALLAGAFFILKGRRNR